LSLLSPRNNANPTPLNASGRGDLRVGHGVAVIVSRAPARLDFGGGWTDVPPYGEEMGGFVCNLAIARYAAVRLGQGTSPPRANDDLVTAALRRAGLSNVTVALETDFPPGAGLGGSSAVGVALQAAIAAWRTEDVEREELVRRSRGVEVEELGVAGGWQDHYAAAFGGALGLEFTDRITGRSLPMSDAFATALERRCIVAYTGESRISGDTITAVLDGYRDRKPAVVRALARMAELARKMADAIVAHSVDDLGALVGEHWTHQRSLHPRISTAGIERSLTVARDAGAIGGKALGASGGGCVLAFAQEENEEAVRDAVARVAELVPFTIDRDGVRVERPAETAHA
jgi:D-glycero-alpha-D-manno-heptose-7-phosphate kinase